MPDSRPDGPSCPICELPGALFRILASPVLTAVLLALAILLLFLATLDSARYGTEVAAQAYFGSLIAVWQYPPEWIGGTFLYRFWIPLPGMPVLGLIAIANLIFSGIRNRPRNGRALFRALPLVLVHIGILTVLAGYAALLSANEQAVNFVIIGATVTLFGMLLHYLPALLKTALHGLSGRRRRGQEKITASLRLGRGWILAPLAGIAVGAMLSVSNGPEQMARIYIEKRMELLPTVFYLLTLPLLAVYFRRREATRLYQKALLPILGAAVTVHSILPVCLTFIRGRPPATDLHSTLILAGWLAALCAYWVERNRRNGIAATASALVGLITLLIAQWMGTDFQTPVNPMKASNQWLGLHVVTICAAYGAVLLSVVLANVQLAAARISEKAAENLDGMETLTTWLTRIGLLLCGAGILAGGLWAQQAWGRFWGWDPKENSALMLLFWCALILHVRNHTTGTSAVIRLTACAGILLAWSWAGTNLLGSGLHSYGTGTHAGRWLLAAYALLQAVFASLPRIGVRSGKRMTK